MNPRTHRLAIMIAGAVAVVFGLATIASGGQALFGGSAARMAVGEAVAFVLWFNFCAGFVYVLAGAGMLMRRPWATWLSILIASATIVVFGAFGVHVLLGGAYELRTVGAMTLRSLVWLGISWLAMRGPPSSP